MSNDIQEPKSINHPIKSRADISKSADELLERVNLIHRLWPCANATDILIGCTFVYHSNQQGYEIDISAFAAAMRMPRTSAHRMLNNWKNDDIVSLNRKGRKTIIQLTITTMDRLETFFTFCLNEQFGNED